MKRGFTAKAVIALSVALLGMQSVMVEPASAAAGVPSAPTNVQATVLGADRVQVSWTTPPANGATINGYDVEQSLDNFGGGGMLVTHTLNNSQLITGLNPGVPVYFRVSATTTSRGSGTLSAVVSATPSAAPDAPAQLVFNTVHPPLLDIQWTAPLDNGAPITSYIVEDSRAVPSQLSSDGYTTCTIIDKVVRSAASEASGDVKCWGDNSFGQLGTSAVTGASWGGSSGETGTSVHTVDLGVGHTARAVSVGGDHVCAIREDGSVYCWGNNADGRLGIGTAGGNDAGVVDLGTVSQGVSHTAVSIAAGLGHTCAVLDDFSLKCWGMNDKGQLGLGDTLLRGNDPLGMGDGLPVVDLGVSVSPDTWHWPVQVAAGGNHTCALFSDAQVKCWGENTNGELGLEAAGDVGVLPAQMGANLPFLFLGTNFDVAQLSLADGVSCAVSTGIGGSQVKCWGNNADGQLGQGDTASRGLAVGDMGDSLLPIDLGVSYTPSQVIAGSRHVCVDATDINTVPGQFLKCWGNNTSGQLGMGNYQNYGDGTAGAGMGANLPDVDLGGALFDDVSVGADFTCVIVHENQTALSSNVTCFGANTVGQLGIGSQVARGSVPSDMGLGLVPSVVPNRNYYTIQDPTSSLTSATLRDMWVGVPHSLRILARNASGSSLYSLSNSVMMVGKASAPTGLTWVARTSNSVELVWTNPPDPGSPITDSNVQYSIDGGSNWVDFVPTSSIGTTSHVVVTSLTPGVSTMFRVAAVNAIAVGDWSDSISATPMSTPSQPAQPTMTQVTASSATVNWAAPNANGSDISGYVVEYTVYGQNTWTSLNAAANATSLNITGLVPNLRYEVRVTAQNHAGASLLVPVSGVPSPSQNFTTIAGAPLFQSVLPSNNAPSTPYKSRIDLSWSAPVPNGLASSIGYYNLRYRVVGTLAWTDVNPGNVTSIRIEPLLPGSQYEVELSAHTAFGDGITAHTSFTAASVPAGQPTNLDKTAVFANSVYLQWVAPAYTGGSGIVDYKVEYSEDGGSNWHIYNHTASADVGRLVTGLASGSPYIFRVSAVNASGVGAASAFVGATTRSAPSRVTDLSVVAPFGHSVALTWTNPSDNGTPISDYKVEVSTDGLRFYPWVHENTDPNNTQIIDGLSLATTYWFRVAAYNGGYAQASNIVTADTLNVPGGISGLRATAGEAGANLQWTAPTDDGGSAVVDYAIRYRRVVGGVAGSWVVAARDASSTATGVVIGLVHTSVYDVQVAAVNEPGQGPWSDSVRFTTLATSPGAPASITVQAGNSAVLVSWTAPADNGGSAVTGYEVSRRTGAGAWVVAVAKTSAAARYYVVTGLTNGTTTTFRVRAINVRGSGAYSVERSSGTKLVPMQPAKPVGTARNRGALISWVLATNNRGAQAPTRVLLQQSTDGVRWTTVYNMLTIVKQAPVIGLTNGVNYQFRVIAVNALGQSMPSPVVTVKPRA